MRFDRAWVKINGCPLPRSIWMYRHPGYSLFPASTSRTVAKKNRFGTVYFVLGVVLVRHGATFIKRRPIKRRREQGEGLYHEPYGDRTSLKLRTNNNCSRRTQKPNRRFLFAGKKNHRSQHEQRRNKKTCETKVCKESNGTPSPPIPNGNTQPYHPHILNTSLPYQLNTTTTFRLATESTSPSLLTAAHQPHFTRAVFAKTRPQFRAKNPAVPNFLLNRHCQENQSIWSSSGHRAERGWRVEMGGTEGGGGRREGKKTLCIS